MDKIANTLNRENDCTVVASAGEQNHDPCSMNPKVLTPRVTTSCRRGVDCQQLNIYCHNYRWGSITVKVLVASLSELQVMLEYRRSFLVYPCVILKYRTCW